MLNREFAGQLLDRLQCRRDRLFTRLGTPEVAFHPAEELIGCRIWQDLFVTLRILIVIAHSRQFYFEK